MVAIHLSGVHKTFRIPHERHTTLTERLLHLFHQVEYERFEAVRGVDLAIEKGMFVGIIGRNGSGKSTLLKLMAGLLPPDGGQIRVHGTMSALLELGLGFSAELTVRENVELYAAVLGYPRREIQHRIDAAIDFAELERFRDAKLKNLSTGMRARLGFATALQAESDILLLDEILAVGDESFQRKCIEVFIDLKRRQRTIVLVTHDLHQVQTLCDTAIYIEAGRIAAAGPPDLVIAQYLTSLSQAPPQDGTSADGVPDAENGTTGTLVAETENGAGGDATDAESTMRIAFEGGWLEDETGTPVSETCPGARVTLVCRASATRIADEPIFGMLLNERNGQIIYVTSTFWLGVRTGVLEAGQRVEVRMPFDAPFQPGEYVISIMATNAIRTEPYGTAGEVVSFTVGGAVAAAGAIQLQQGFSCQVVTDRKALGLDADDDADADRGGIS